MQYVIYTKQYDYKPLGLPTFVGGFQRILVQENLKNVSKEFLGNHQIPAPVKLNVQGSLHDDGDDDDGDDDDDDDDDVTFNAQVAKLCVAR